MRHVRGHRKKLLHQSIMGQVILGLALMIGTSLCVGIFYYHQSLNQASNVANGYAKTAAEYIDGDRVLGYLATGEKDAYYEEVKNYLTVAQNNSEILYYYVYLPQEDDIIYIWDADGSGDARDLGEHENYGQGGKEMMQRVFCKNPKQEILLMEEDPYGYIAVAFAPIFDSFGEPVALVGVDLSMPQIISSSVSFIVTVAAVIVSLIIISVLVNILVVNRILIRPITVLKNATEKLVENIETDEEVVIDIHSDNELEDLANSYLEMNKELKEYIKELATITAEKERITAELSVATQIQAGCLPKIFPKKPACTELDLFASMNPAKEVGGDFYDFFWIDDDHFAIVIADVSGKGVPAALFMMISKILLKNQAMALKSPSETLTVVNNQLLEGNENDMFVTVWLGILDVNTGIITASNAGHEYPTIKKKGGDFELFKDKHGFVLSGMEDFNYHDYEIQMEPGDMLFVYTDGVLEATDSADELFGPERLLRGLNRDADSTVESLLSNVQSEIDSFVKDAPQFDDITMLAMEFHGRNRDD